MYYCNIETAQQVDKAISEALSVGEQFKNNLNQLLKTILDNRGNILWNFLAICLIFLLARLVLRLISRITGGIMASDKYNTSSAPGRRMHTLMTLFRSVSRYVVYIIAFFLTLGFLGLGKPLNTLLAAAGLGSLAFGFGAQNLVRDVVTGLFMIFENQFAVGDYIKTDEAEGTVEATAMRVTYLRSLKGDQIIIPNGSISRVVNYTRGGYIASITVSTSYEANTRRVLEYIDQAVQQYATEHEDLIEEAPIVQGITSLSPSSTDIGVICKVKPMKQWEVERGMRLAIKEMFEQNKISFPYPHYVVVPYSPPVE